MDQKPARTRIAPSPTGRFQVANARNALFAYIVARQTGGQFILRFEDTDLKRFVPGSEEEIVRSMRLVWEVMKIVIEPSAAVPLACLLDRSIDVAGARVGVILSGCNVDLDRLPRQA